MSIFRLEFDFSPIISVNKVQEGLCLIGERLYDLRKDAGLTQDELAAIPNINKHSISSYEREKSEPPDAIKIGIAKYFHVSVDYLLGLTDDPNVYSTQNNILRLPSKLPAQARESIQDYASYLTHKYLSSDQSATKK